MSHEKQIDDLHEALASTEAELSDAREALARVGAERDEFWDVLDQQNARVIELQEQLAKAVGLLEKVTETTGWDLRDGPLISQVHDFLLPHREAALMKDKGGRHAHAEQQEALSDAELMEVAMFVGSGNKAARRASAIGAAELPDHLAPNQEAQGAQAEPENFGQELEAFEKWRHTQADSLRRCGYPDGADAFIRLGSVQWAGWHARAALATQPAAGEPVATVSRWFVSAWNDGSGNGGGWKQQAKFLTDLPDGTKLYTAQPAAAHGDELYTAQARLSEALSLLRKVDENGEGLYRSLHEDIQSFLAGHPAAHGDEAVRKDARLLELYQAPFRFDERGGYIWDAQNNMVADNHVDGDQAMRVRGWGRLSYRQDGEEVQDLMGQAMADALTARWEAAMRAQAGEGGEM